MSHDSRAAGPGQTEFIALMALMISLVALSIDSMLPALHAIGTDLHAATDNDRQLVVSALFFGLAAAQMFFGPISDSIGRKPTIYLGVGIFCVGCLISIFSTEFHQMLAGRALQGIGVAGPRVVTVAIVRDRYEGDAMAKIMSLIMSVFILVPVLAPTLGQGILLIADWRMIFVALLVLALSTLIWFGLRQVETLPPQRRRPFSAKPLLAALGCVFSHRQSVGYMVAGGLVFGAFIGYLNSSQQILQDQFGLGTLFPLYFAVLAISIGAASFLNSRLVLRLGMHRLAHMALRGLSLLSLGFFIFAILMDKQPPLAAFMAYMLPAFFAVGILFGNLNAMAMLPFGHIAGMAAAVVGAVTTLISVSLGMAIGQFYDGTVMPLITGFLGLSVAATATLSWAEGKVDSR